MSLLVFLTFVVFAPSALTTPITNDTIQVPGTTELPLNEVEGTVLPQVAKCMPEKQVVMLRTSHDLSLRYHPACTRVERCGGCCAVEEFLKCQPTEIEYINFRVTVSKFHGLLQSQPSRKEIIRVERHLKCKCNCIVQPKDCNHLQEYVQHECQCQCTNHDEKRKCLEDNLKSWDRSNCTCQCNDKKDCTTGYTFNKHTCSCEPERQRIRGGDISYRRREP